MNNLYHWHDERMVDLEMKEINRELEQANLLKEAGISGANWLAGAVDVLRNVLITRMRALQDHPSTEHESYPSVSDKLAR